MRVTLQDIANKLNVSKSLVAGVLTNNPAIRTTPEKRQRILAAANEMGYAPHLGAKMLRSGKTNNIVLAYVQPTIDSSRLPAYEYNATTIKAFAVELGRFGYALNVRSDGDIGQISNELREIVQSHVCDAVVLWGSASDTEELGQLLESLGQPFVVYGQYDNHPDWVQADFDHPGMMHQSVSKLVELGHERIAYLGIDCTEAFAKRYLSAYHAAMAETFRGSIPDSWILLSRESNESSEEIVRQVESWFDLPVSERPTALAVGQGGSIVDVVEFALISRGIRIGEGDGGFGIAGLFGYPLRRLLAGYCWGFPGWSEVHLIDQVIHDQLIPLARDGKPKQQVVSHLPSLRWNIPSLTPAEQAILGIEIGCEPAILKKIAENQSARIGQRFEPPNG